MQELSNLVQPRPSPHQQETKQQETSRQLAILAGLQVTAVCVVGGWIAPESDGGTGGGPGRDWSYVEQ